MDNQYNPTPTPAPTSGKKNPFTAFLQAKRALPTWALILGILLACSVGYGLAGSSSAAGTTTTNAAQAGTGGTHTTTTAKPPTATAKPPTATPAPKLTTIASFSGTSQKNTQTFHVSANQWTLVWTCQGGEFGGNFSVEVDNADGSIFDPLAANVVCNGTMHDTTIERGSGDFYLKVDADVSWTIQIQAVQ